MFWKRSPTSPNNYYGTPRNDNQIVSLAYNMQDDFIARLEDDLHEAAHNKGYNLTVLDSQSSPSLQLEQVKSAKRKGARGILVNLVTPDMAPAVLEAAKGMKVIFIDFAPGDRSLLGPDAIYVGADQKSAGRLQGEWLANYFKERGKNEIRYILLKGIPGLPLAEQRTQAMLQALLDNGVQATAAVKPIIANLNQMQAMMRLLPVLRSGVKFDAIIAANDAMALGAIQALESQGMDPKKTVIVGIDATEPGVRALLSGELDMTVYQNKIERAAGAIKAMDNMLQGRPFDEGLERLTTPENPYAIIYPFETVTRYHIPRDLYF